MPNGTVRFFAVKFSGAKVVANFVRQNQITHVAYKYTPSENTSSKSTTPDKMQIPLRHKVQACARALGGEALGSQVGSTVEFAEVTLAAITQDSHYGVARP